MPLPFTRGATVRRFDVGRVVAPKPTDDADARPCTLLPALWDETDPVSHAEARRACLTECPALQRCREYLAVLIHVGRVTGSASEWPKGTIAGELVTDASYRPRRRPGRVA